MSRVKPSKSLGQNFLIDKQVISDIVEGAGIGEDDLVIEIGPGTGALTGRLLSAARRVIAIEIDSKLVDLLHTKFLARENLTLVWGDILKTDVKALIAAEREKDPALGKVQIVGNLPYYITTPIMMHLLEEDVPFEAMTFMMQKEVGERILAAPSHKSYGALSVAVQYYCHVTEIREVSRNSFRPVPKVESLVLKLTRREEKLIDPKDPKLFFACVKTAFSKRRKTLRNCFTRAFGLDKEQAEALLLEAGIDPELRGEALSIEEFGRLADVLAERG